MHGSTSLEACVITAWNIISFWSVQVSELQQQLSDQLQELKGSGREEQLQSEIRQLQTQLRNVRDIHGVSMPLLDSDEGILADVPELAQTGVLELPG